MRNQVVALLGALAALSLVSVTERASAGEVHCGTSVSGWNAPAGAIVLERSAGPVKATLDAVGEYGTHSMMSHGAGGWVTHSTMTQPQQQGWPSACSTPLDPGQLQNGYPGASQTNQGGIYTFLYGNGAPEAIWYQNGNGDGANRGASVANYLWSTVAYQSVTARDNSGFSLYQLKLGGSVTNYSLYQYRNVEGRGSGGGAWNNGIVCSSLLAWAQATSGSAWGVNPSTYSHAQVSSAISGLWNGVNNDCHSSMGFWSHVGTTFACFDSDLCDEAADQVTNCMSAGVCNTGNNNYWKNVNNDGSTVAVAISPDLLGGWSGHPYGSAAPNPVWSYDNKQTVQWNSGGNVYGCWE